MLVALDRQFAFEQGIVDGLVLIEIGSRNLPQVFQRFLDEGFFRMITLVGIIVEQMIVAFDAVVNGFGRVELEILLEIVVAEFSKFGHAGEISPKRSKRNFADTLQCCLAPLAKD